MYRWADRLGAQEADAADLVQDVMLHLMRVLPQFEYDRQRSFRAWLRTVLANKWRDSCRKRSPVAIADGQLDLATNVLDDVQWDDAYDRAELCREAMKLIRSEFSEVTWSAFAETAVHGRPAAQVASQLNLSTNAIYLARGRVLRRLRQELEGLWE